MLIVYRYTGDITYTPITTTSPASMYWGINQDVTYGQNGTSLLSGNAGIVDTGTTLLLIATDAFQKYQQATGATLDRYVVLGILAHVIMADFGPLQYHRPLERHSGAVREPPVAVLHHQYVMLPNAYHDLHS